MPESLGMTQIGESTPERLIAGDFPVITEEITIAAGAGALVRGTLLGKITASGEYITSLTAAIDGSEDPDCILSRDVDASAAAVICEGYFSGEFNQDAITYGAGHTAASVKDALRAKSIHLKASLAA